MSSDELTCVSPTPSPPRPSSIFSYKSSNADDAFAEEPSYDTATTIRSEIQSEDGNSGPGTITPIDNYTPSIPSPLEHGHSRMYLVIEWIRNIQPETHLVENFLPQLRLAVILLRKLRRSFGLDPSRLLEESDAQRVWTAIEEGNIDAVFEVPTDENIVLDPEVLVDLTQVSKDCAIDGGIFSEVELLEIVQSLRMDCQDGRPGQSLLPNYLYTVTIVYLASIQTLDCGGFFKSQKLEVFRSLGLLQRKPAGSVAI
ncbi:hypothetical protein AU210_016280 [Fusarium oxysporum f. sp. radicis-cucumerinum]|uniref:Uncharacterized protein n=1 Tax=Fusarium oxysporum f. sp. radicis-cucumerinum TaxID=327505 RepID=A0A2H3G2D2_FUSOX|nr:hypothetical protein AU210_016280 [Fusarium oxysporum f. sp. radicis-cucumerinum]